MKTIGMLGGMSWESTQTYYQEINEGIKATLGGLHSAEILLHSVNFDSIAKLQRVGDWQATADILTNAAQNLEKSGADCLLICTNTMHKIAPEVQASIQIPLLHIADATAEQLISAGIKQVGLLGTAFTMEQDFYKSRLQDKYGLEVITPNAADRKMVHDIIFNELCVGQIKETSKVEYLRIMDELVAQGAEGVILGCTEIGLLVQQADTNIPLFDTTKAHAQAAVDYALN